MGRVIGFYGPIIAGMIVISLCGGIRGNIGDRTSIPDETATISIERAVTAQPSLTGSASTGYVLTIPYGYTIK